MSRMFARAKKVLEKADRVRIVGRRPTFFSIKGRTAIPCAGEFNMPDGEIFTAPVETSTEGRSSSSSPRSPGTGGPGSA